MRPQGFPAGRLTDGRPKRWIGTETQICTALGKRHIGGPGQPDCHGGGEVVEVKVQRRPVNQWQMKEILSRPWSAG